MRDTVELFESNIPRWRGFGEPRAVNHRHLIKPRAGRA